MGSLAISPNSRRAYALALALLAAALLGQWALRPMVGIALPFLFVLPAVGIAAMWGGWRPALLVLAGGLVHLHFWLQPQAAVPAHPLAMPIVVLSYLLAGGLLLALGGRVSQLRARAERAERDVSRQLQDLQRLQADRETAQREAQASSLRLEVALQTSAVPFCLLEPLRGDDGRVQGFRWSYLNGAAARLFRREAGQLVGQPVRGTLGNETQVDPGLLERLAGALREGGTRRFESWAEAQGRRRWFELIASPYGEGLAVWFSDISERRAQEEALREADRRKDEFLATLAHELRNPLAPIRQAASIARSPAASEAQKQWSQGVIERQVGHMALLLDDLLDVSRITRGKLELRLAPVALADAVEAALETARPLVEQRRQQLATRLPPEPLWLHADRLRLAQVLSNLLANASKYTPEGGHIALQARAENGRALVEVRDSGVGIAAEAHEAIFEMFTQVRGGPEGRGGGLGIGLALSRGLVELHGGRLRAHSEGLGQGSTFSVELPLSAAPAAHLDAPAQPAAAVAARRILVADDNRDAAQTLADLLRMEGHDVVLAFDGQEALERYDEYRPEVALLDIGMPRLTGNEVASAIRERPRGARTLLVAITGWGQERDRGAARAAGFDHHFTKPVDPLRLLELLRAGLRPSA